MKSFIFLTLVLLPAMAWSQRVVFISPGKSNEAYWVTTAKYMEMAANSLNMQLEVKFAEREHFKPIDIARELVARSKEDRPDYVIFPNDYGVAPTILNIFSETDIRSLMAFSSPTTAERQQTGAPRERYKNWIGSIEPRAEDAGYLTASALIDKGRALNLKGQDHKIHLVAIAGDRSTNTSILRNEGMRKAVSEAKDVVLDQVVYADWSEKKAAEQSAWLIDRYPQAKLVWAANDLMAFGAMQSFEERGMIPGKTALFSGINTSPQALNDVQSGRLSALAGGHFMTGAMAIVMIYDYDHGKDFASEGVELIVPMFTLLTPKKAQIFVTRFGEKYNVIDFKKYTKVHSKLKTYNFEFDRFLK
jgi:ABC-type sugar transport system substrate-binding protein